MKKRIVILASGGGTNAQAIMEHFKGSKKAEVVLVVSNRKEAKVLERAKKMEVEAAHFDRNAFFETGEVLRKLQETKPDLIVLAGFLLKVPLEIIKAFPDKIINIHPALLPNYGGKGMYGAFVHQSVHQNKEPETGISIHYVNENYDEGALIFQKTVSLSASDTPESIAEKVQQLEHAFYPEVIEQLLFPEKKHIIG